MYKLICFICCLLALGGIGAAIPVNSEKTTVDKKDTFCANSTPLIDKLTPPKLITKFEPQFPEEALKKERTGTPIIAEIRISERGEVTKIRILTSKHPDLNPFVIKALKKWKYKPAMKADKPVAVCIQITTHIDVH
jgi:TonB family protein